MQIRPEVIEPVQDRRHGTSIKGLHTTFPLCPQCFHISEYSRHDSYQIQMFMEPNPSWLLGFIFLTFTQKQLHPKLERDFITLFHDA